MYNNPLARSLDKMTMHKLIQIILTGHVLIACILGAFGLVRFNPLQIIASTIVLVAVSVLANKLLAKLYGVRSDSHSPVITGLILALVLTPDFSPLRLAVLALIALIAQASKYVLALRGRHIFNPVVVALVIASLAGLSYASWWIAAPPIVYLTLFAAFVMLYKLRLLRYGLIFVLVSAAIITFQGITTGSSFIGSLSGAFTSWPIFFFVAFMLTEPTTLPPRRRQKYLVAALVGTLFALPFSIGPFNSSPAVALLVGNGIAFLFGQRRAIILAFKDSKSLSPTIKEYIFTPASPLRFLPGQYADLYIPHAKTDFKASRRSFSLTSIPGADTVSFGIRLSEPLSSFKRELTNLRTGQKITASVISGDFILPNDPQRKLLFIAGGIGITPFVSQIRSLRENGETRDIVLILLARNDDAALYSEEMKAVQSHVMTDGRPDAKRIVSAVPDIAERDVYISGPPAMVDSVKATVRKAGARKVRTDYFSGY